MQSGREKEAARLLSERNRLRKAEQEATRLQRVVKTHFPSSISPPP